MPLIRSKSTGTWKIFQTFIQKEKNCELRKKKKMLLRIQLCKKATAVSVEWVDFLVSANDRYAHVRPLPTQCRTHIHTHTHRSILVFFLLLVCNETIMLCKHAGLLRMAPYEPEQPAPATSFLNIDIWSESHCIHIHSSHIYTSIHISMFAHTVAHSHMAHGVLYPHSHTHTHKYLYGRPNSAPVPSNCQCRLARKRDRCIGEVAEAGYITCCRKMRNISLYLYILFYLIFCRNEAQGNCVPGQPIYSHIMNFRSRENWAFGLGLYVQRNGLAATGDRLTLRHKYPVNVPGLGAANTNIYLLCATSAIRDHPQFYPF